MEPHGAKLARDVHAAVASLEGQAPLGPVHGDRAIARGQRELAGDFLRLDAAVTRVQLDPALHPLDVDRAVTAPGLDVGARGTHTISARSRRVKPDPLNDSVGGFFTSTSMVSPSWDDLTSSASTASRVGPRFSISTSTSGLSHD